LLPAHDLDAPRIAGCEQRIRVDVVEPSDEVRLRILLRRAVDSGASGIELPAQFVTALERRKTFLDGAPFCIPFTHGEGVLHSAVRSTRAGSSAGRAGDF